ncbi:hypothetical protein CEXT_343261 [Caerostris extrusa]|uniref:Uncharacterized protein n=1 Tax=Caerostris extrusa TaxID=172846 RepID=A0AAV4VHJ3_CAEEX|nr:hypothetical protein CEXT_343261 [Caerostris extrusa]
MTSFLNTADITFSCKLETYRISHSFWEVTSNSDSTTRVCYEPLFECELAFIKKGPLPAETGPSEEVHEDDWGMTCEDVCGRSFMDWVNLPKRNCAVWRRLKDEPSFHRCFGKSKGCTIVNTVLHVFSSEDREAGRSWDREESDFIAPSEWIALSSSPHNFFDFPEELPLNTIKISTGAHLYGYTVLFNMKF